MGGGTTFSLIVGTELLILAWKGIPYAWERFIAFGQARFDAFYVEATPWGDVCELPAAARVNAGEGRNERSDRRRIKDETAPHRNGGL